MKVPAIKKLHHFKSRSNTRAMLLRWNSVDFKRGTVHVINIHYTISFSCLLGPTSLCAKNTLEVKWRYTYFFCKCNEIHLNLHKTKNNAADDWKSWWALRNVHEYNYMW